MPWSFTYRASTGANVWVTHAGNAVSVCPATCFAVVQSVPFVETRMSYDDPYAPSHAIFTRSMFFVAPRSTWNHSSSLPAQFLVPSTKLPYFVDTLPSTAFADGNCGSADDVVGLPSARLTSDSATLTDRVSMPRLP